MLLCQCRTELLLLRHASLMLFKMSQYHATCRCRPAALLSYNFEVVIALCCSHSTFHCHAMPLPVTCHCDACCFAIHDTALPLSCCFPGHSVCHSHATWPQSCDWATVIKACHGQTALPPSKYTPVVILLCHCRVSLPLTVQIAF